MPFQKKTLAIIGCIIGLFVVCFAGGFYLALSLQNQTILLAGVAILFVFLMWLGSGAELLTLLHDWYRATREKPQLSIDYDKKNRIFFPEVDVTNPYNTLIGKRTYQKICIKNSGGVARNCEAELQVKKGNNSTIHPSEEPKLLVWWTSSKDNILLKQDIGGKIGAKYLYVVFSEIFFANKHKDNNDIYAFVSTKEEVYRKDIRTRYNGFGVGEFEFEVIIKSEDGSFVKSIFRLHVEKDFRKISMEKISEVNK